MEISNLFIPVLTNVLTIIGILNPFGNVPLFMSMTQGQKPEVRKKIYNLIVITGFGILTAFIFTGNFFMNYLFKIDMNELRVAGGMILIIVALRNLLGISSSNTSADSHEMTMKEATRFAVTPLTFPIMVGPGSISTVLIIRQESGVWITLGAVLLTFLIIKFLFSISKFLDRIFGELVLYVLSRIMQIFIMAVGVKLIVMGLKAIFSLI